MDRVLACGQCVSLKIMCQSVDSVLACEWFVSLRIVCDSFSLWIVCQSVDCVWIVCQPADSVLACGQCVRWGLLVTDTHTDRQAYSRVRIKMKVKVTITIMPPLCTFVFSCQRPVSLTENQQWDALGNSSYPENQRKIQKSAMRIPLWDAFGVMAHILSKEENFCIFRFCLK